MSVSPEWAIVYDDKTIYDNRDGSFEDAPGWGVQAIVYQARETGWSILGRGDNFHRLPSGIVIPIGSDAIQEWSVNVWKTVKAGRMMDRLSYAEVHGLAMSIMRDVTKTGHFRNELKDDNS